MCFFSIKGARLIADLCLDYQIYDVQLWNILLPQLLSFGLVKLLFLYISFIIWENYSCISSLGHLFPHIFSVFTYADPAFVLSNCSFRFAI